MTSRLHVDTLTSIGAVEAGDNEPSKILFWKRKTHEPAKGQPVKKEGSMSTFDVESLPEDAREYVAGLQAQIADLSGDTPTDLPEDLPDIVKSRLDENDATIAKMQAEQERISKENAALRDQIETEKWRTRAEALAVLLGDPETVAPVIKTLAADSPDAWAQLDAMFDTLIVKDSLAPLFKELGDSSVEGSAVDEIKARAADIKKANPELSDAEARAQAWRENPELKARSREEA